MSIFRIVNRQRVPRLWVAAVPIVVLLLIIAVIGLAVGAQRISDYTVYSLVAASLVAAGIGFARGYISRRSLAVGFRRGVMKILPILPVLVCLGAISTTWVLSGVVPTMLDYGMRIIAPQWFLPAACVVCAMVSVVTGSSWTTIATIGIVFMGMGSVMGYSEVVTAGAVISGAYFGDKVSPLSDTTVLASSTCGVDIMDHIKYMMITTIPAMALTLVIFAAVSLSWDTATAASDSEVLSMIHAHFNVSALTMVIPGVAILLLALKVRTLTVLIVSALMGAAGIMVFQPQLDYSAVDILLTMWQGSTSATGCATFDAIATTGGVLGMWTVLELVTATSLLGWMLISTGMLRVVGNAIVSGIRRRTSLVSATIGTGFTMNAITCDQYLSLIITGNIFAGAYRRHRLRSRLLSRSCEDGVSVTSVLIPWNTCGMTQSAVLGVATLSYLPFCVFNYLTPLVSILIARIGFRTHKRM